MIKMFKGIPVYIPNTISEDNKDEHFHVSYNPSYRDYGIDTTALVVMIGDNEREVYYILKGNHTEQYAACKNLAERLAYYMNNQELKHEYSDTFEH